MMCHYVIFDFAFSCTQSALIALPHTDISRKGNMTNISHLTLPFPPSLHLSRVHNHPSSSNQRHLNPQPPRPMTLMPDTSSPCVAWPSTSTASTDDPDARCHKSLYHLALNPQPSTTDNPNAQCLKSPRCPALDPQPP